MTQLRDSNKGSSTQTFGGNNKIYVHNFRGYNQRSHGHIDINSHNASTSLDSGKANLRNFLIHLCVSIC